MNGKTKYSIFFLYFSEQKCFTTMCHEIQSDINMPGLSSLASVSQNVSFHYCSQLVSLTLSSLVSQIKKLPTKLTLNSLCILSASVGKLCTGMYQKCLSCTQQCWWAVLYPKSVEFQFLCISSSRQPSLCSQLNMLLCIFYFLGKLISDWI